VVASRRFVALAAPNLGGSDARAVSDAVRSGWVSGVGPYVDRFERRFARRIGVPHAAALASGTAALHLALIALGGTRGDEIIVPALTFVATANVVAYVGMRVSFADVDEETWNLSPSAVERRLTRRTRGLLPVHFSGLPADMSTLAALAREHRLYVVEDAAQAIGARHQGRPAGGLGDAAAFSFFANKVMTTGEGGILTTARSRVDRRVRALRSHAKLPGPRYIHSEIGFSYRMTSLQAALGLAQLARLSALLARRRGVAARYRRALPRLGFICQGVPDGDTHCYSFFGVLCRTHSSRQRALRALSREGIEARPFFEPLNRLVPHRTTRRFPVSEELSKRGLFIPCSAALADEEVRRVIAALGDVGP
jgi:perosamine synthetase